MDVPLPRNKGSLLNVTVAVFDEPMHSGVIVNYRVPRRCDNSYHKESTQRASRRAAVTGIFGVMTLRECFGVQHWFLMCRLLISPISKTTWAGN